MFEAFSSSSICYCYHDFFPLDKFFFIYSHFKRIPRQWKLNMLDFLSCNLTECNCCMWLWVPLMRNPLLSLFIWWTGRHFLICLYGALVLGLILAGQLKEHKIIYILTGNLMFIQMHLACVLSFYRVFVMTLPLFSAYYGIEHSFSSLSPHLVQVS